MDNLHPHAEATYRIMPLDGGAFGVDVAIPDTHPTMVTGFSCQQAAEAWIANHEQQVRSNSTFQKKSPRFSRKVS
jgi:hypothetical protein